MPKKVRYQPRKAGHKARAARVRRVLPAPTTSTAEAGAAPTSAERIPAPSPRPAATPVTTPRPRSAKAPVADYRYVAQELRRIGVIVGAISLILIILALVLR